MALVASEGKRSIHKPNGTIKQNTAMTLETHHALKSRNQFGADNGILQERVLAQV